MLTAGRGIPPLGSAGGSEETGIARVVPSEVIAVEAEAQRQPASQDVTEVGHPSEVVQHRMPQARDRGREQVRAVQRRSGADLGVARSELGAEVEALLAIRNPRRQLASDRKVSAPRASTACHVDLELALEVACEELAREPDEPIDRRLWHTVPDRVEEAEIPASGTDLRRRAGACSVVARAEAADVDDRKTRVPSRAPVALPPHPMRAYLFAQPPGQLAANAPLPTHL